MNGGQRALKVCAVNLFPFLPGQAALAIRQSHKYGRRHVFPSP